MMKKIVLALGLLAALVQLLWPPTRIVGDTGGLNPYTVVVYRRQAVWQATDKIVFLRDDEQPTAAGGLIFTRGMRLISPAWLCRWALQP
jgi:hypothetical protein